MAMFICSANFHVNQVETTSARASFEDILKRTNGVITNVTVNSQESACLSKLTNTRRLTNKQTVRQTDRQIMWDV